MSAAPILDLLLAFNGEVRARGALLAAELALPVGDLGRFKAYDAARRAEAATRDATHTVMEAGLGAEAAQAHAGVLP